jgi:FMN reductase
MLVVAVVGSPHAGGRTRVAVDAVLRGAAEQGCDTRVLELAETGTEDAVAAMGDADAVVFGSPTYRADIAAQLKALLDATPRGMAYESGDPLRGTTCATVLTGASDHHFLAVEKVRGILGGFFGAQLLSPGLYLPSAAYTDDGRALRDDLQELAELHGRALVELATAVRSSRFLRELRPLI